MNRPSHLLRLIVRRSRCLVLLTCLLVTLAPCLAIADVTDPTVVAGAANVNGLGTSHVTINQLSNRAVVNWQGFSIDPGQLVQFNQPGAHAAILNRVTGGDPSALLGTMQANGQVYLINPAGIIVGNGAHIDVGGFVASTLDVSNAQFMQGGNMTFSGDSLASVANYGEIRALEGDIFLIGANVQNHGLLHASHGTVGLAAGSSVTLMDSANPHLVVNATSKSLGTTGVVNTGVINAARAELAANGGNVYALAINNEGSVRATGFKKEGGRVFLTSEGGKIQNTGDLVAKTADATTGTVSGGTVEINSGAGGTSTVGGSIDVQGLTGGDVRVLGDAIQLAGAAIDASGSRGGGNINIGGSFQGKGPLLNATTTRVDASTTLNADATLLGAGGQVIVWSDDTTTFAGNITARGAGQNGNGGFAEVSGKLTLDFTGMADLSALSGSTGTLLLDPTNLTIEAAEAAVITNALRSANVVVSTNSAGGQDGNVRIDSPIIYSESNDLAILAFGDIIANASVQNNGTGDLTLVAGWDGTTGFSASSGVQFGQVDFSAILNDPSSFGNAKLNGGNGSIFIGTGNQTAGIAVGSRSGESNFAGASMTLMGGNTSVEAFAQAGFRADSSQARFNIDGPITIALSDGLGNPGDLTATGGRGSSSYVQVGHGGRDTTTFNPEPDGDFAGAITIFQANDVNFAGGSGQRTFAQLGHGGIGADGDHSGAITITQAGALNFEAGSMFSSYAQLGHGGQSASGDHSGDISITGATDLSLTGGMPGGVTYVQLGHGGFGAGGNHTGNIDINITGNLNIVARDAADAYAQLGHGGSGVDGMLSGDIRIITSGDLNVTSGSEFRSYAQLGHGGHEGIGSAAPNAVLGLTADIDLTINGGVTLLADQTNGTARIGHGGRGFTSTGDGLDGAIVVNADGGITSTASGENSVAQIGHGGFGASGSMGDISVSGLFIELLATGPGSTAQYGHGGPLSSGDHTGNIMVTADGTSAGEGFVRLMASGGLDLAGFVGSTAQIGHGGDSATGSGLGDITVIANGPDDTFFAIDLSTPGTSNFAHVGHGGVLYNDIAVLPGAISGMITVNALAGSVNAIAGGSFSPVQLGHGGPAAVADSLAGAINVTTSTDITFTGGDSLFSYAQLGHGGLLSITPNGITGAIDVATGNNLNFTSGPGLTAYTQLGHGGDTSDGNADGTISVVANDVSFSAVLGAENAYAQLGHGGNEVIGDLSGAIMVTANDLNFSGGPDNDTYAQLGHGGDSVFGMITGDITVLASGNLTFAAGLGEDAYVQLGHGGNHVLGEVSGRINVTANDLEFSGGSTTDNAYAHLGHGGNEAIGSFMGAIEVTANDVTFTGGEVNDTYAQLGHGGDAAAGSHDGAIQLTVADVTFTGGTGTDAYAQLGHGGEDTDGNFSGDIVVNLVSSDLLLMGGSGLFAYSQLGHGAASGNSTGTRSGDITVIANGSATLNGASSLERALLGHATASQGSITGNLVLAVDQVDPLADNGGRLFMNEFSLIDMGGLPNQVRIFGTRRLGNVLADGAIVNGIIVDSTLSPGTLVGNRWNPNIEFVSWDHEQWGSDAGTFTLAAPGPYTTPFTFYYLSLLDAVPGLPEILLDFQDPYDRFGRYEDFASSVMKMFPNGPYSAIYGPPRERASGQLAGSDSYRVFGTE